MSEFYEICYINERNDRKLCKAFAIARYVFSLTDVIVPDSVEEVCDGRLWRGNPSLRHRGLKICGNG